MLSKIIYEKKYNSYKNSNNINKNYKMSKYLNKLNGGAEPRTINPSNLKNEIGSGGFGKVFDFKLDSDKEQSYVAKVFNHLDKNVSLNTENYNNEKELYMRKMSIYCGKLNINETGDKKYTYTSPLLEKMSNQIMLIEPRISKNHDPYFVITNEIIDYIKTLFPTQSEIINSIIGLIIYKSKPLVYGLYPDKSRKIIGTYVVSLISNSESYLIYIDTFNIMRLIYFDDINRTLIYKNLGMDLYDAMVLNKIKIPELNQRILLCIDLLRQVNDIFLLGINHNDIKLENIVIKYINGNYFLTIIDYGIAKFIKEIRYMYDKNDNTNLSMYPTNRQYNPEIYEINRLFVDKFNRLMKKVDFSEIENLFYKSLHWSLGGLFIAILNWSGINESKWLEYYNEYDKNCEENNRICIRCFNMSNPENFKIAKLYIESIFKYIPYEIKYNPTKNSDYMLLKEIINNLLQISTDSKILLSKHYENIKDKFNFQEYLKARKESGIDN